MCEMMPYEMCISEAPCTLNSERISSTFNSYSEGSWFESRPDYCPNFLHRYSDVHFCVYFSLPSWRYFKDCPCGLLKLKAFFFITIPTDIFLRFLCVFFICILIRVPWVFWSLIFTIGLFYVFRNYPDRSYSFLCVFFICILIRASWVFLSLIFTTGLFYVFRNYPDRSYSFLCVFFTCIVTEDFHGFRCGVW